MRKTVCFIVVLAIVWTIIAKGEVQQPDSLRPAAVSGESGSVEKVSLQKSISTKLIRFHVIANSDSIEDQSLKLKVRDRVLEFISPKLKNSKSIEESRNIIKKNDKAIRAIAEKVVRENRYDYKVATALSMENFPVKSYGNITLPQGKYEAYRILIGSGKGQNWWCVMFPPLCFVDVTKSTVDEEKTKAVMKKALNNDEYAAVNNNVASNSPETKEIKIRFKIVDLFNDLKDKFKNMITSKFA